MKNRNIDVLFDQTSALLSELAIVSNKNGFHLDNDLEGMLFSLFLDEDINEMLLFKHRVETAISKIKDGTFKIREADKILSNHKVA